MEPLAWNHRLMALKLVLIITLVISILPALAVGIARGRFYFAFLLLLAFYTISLPFTSAYEGFSLKTIVVASLFAAGCNAVFSLLLIKFDTKYLPPQRLQNLEYQAPQAFDLMFVGLSGVLLALMLIEGLQLAFLDVWSQRALGGGIISSIRTSAVFGLFCLWPTVRNKWVIAAAVPMLALGFMTTGARAILFAGVGYVIYWGMARLSLKSKLAVLPLGLAGAFALHITSRIVRGVGVADLLSGHADLGQLFDLSSIDFTGGESEIPKTFLFAIESVLNGTWDFRPLVTLRRLFFFYLPTTDTFALIKPQDLTYDLWNFAYLNGYFDESAYRESLRANFLSSQTGSLHPTIWGDALLNMAWPSLFVWPVLFAAFVIFLERYLSLKRMIVDPRILANAAAPALMYVVRGNVYLGIFLLIVGALVAWAATQAARPRLGAAP